LQSHDFNLLRNDQLLVRRSGSLDFGYAHSNGTGVRVKGDSGTHFIPCAL
jgi:hypothetical protein